MQQSSLANEQRDRSTVYLLPCLVSAHVHRAMHSIFPSRSSCIRFCCYIRNSRRRRRSLSYSISLHILYILYDAEAYSERGE